MYQTIRRKISIEFADILLAKKLGADISKDGKYFMFNSSVTSDEYDRQRREMRRENEKIYSGMSKYSDTAFRQKHVTQTDPYYLTGVYRKNGCTI